MLVRECTEADLDALERHLPTGRNRAHAAHVERQRTGAAAYLGAWRDGHPVGSCVVAWDGQRDPAARAAYPHHAEISHLWVHPAVRGQGVGTALVRAAEERARRRGHPGVGLSVADDNAGAARLYRRLGYVDTGLRWTAAYGYYDEAGVLRHAEERSVVLVRDLT